jgi:hypothetical protein
VWKNKNISRKTKLRIFSSNVNPLVWLRLGKYQMDNWTSTNLVNRCLRHILNIKWPETISNEELWRIS